MAIRRAVLALVISTAAIPVAGCGAGAHPLQAAETLRQAGKPLPERPASEPRSRQTSDWGSPERGVQMRATAPVEVEQGVPVNVELVLRSDPEELPAGVRELNTFLSDRHLELSLRDRQTGKAWTVKPHDPTGGLPPPRDEGRSVVPLDRASPQHWTAMFPLAEVYESLPPGSYEGRVRFSFPEERRISPRQWHGNVTSGPFRLKVAPATPRTEVLRLPERLRLSRTLAKLRADDPEETAVPVVTFTKEDVAAVTVPVRNGHFIGTWIYRNGEHSTLDGGPPHPVRRNHIDTWYDYKGGRREVSYTIEVFETAEPPQHGWMPGPGSAGFKVLWTETFAIDFTEEEIRKVLASPPPADSYEGDR